MPDPTASVSLIAAVSALAGALGSQAINAWASKSLKKMEISTQIRADAYAELIAALGDFALNPKDQASYVRYLAAYQKAKVFASDEVAQHLEGAHGINYSAQKLRQAEAGNEEEGIKVSSWYEAVERLTSAMREDLRHLRDERT